MRYASPEVPGRLDAVGINADLYSIGVMAYEWISGDAPFASNDLLTMAHRQMSFEPEPLYVTSGTPLAVSDLVDRLIQKSRHRRYATVDGLLWDLRECLTRIAHDAKIEPFALGSHDHGATLQFHDRLYGRDAEVAALDDMYQRALRGEVILCTMAGYSGIGKTSLVRSLRDPVNRAQGFLVEGKYDQSQSATPYAAVMEVFTSLVRGALAREPEQVNAIKQRIMDKVGPSVVVLKELVPGLGALIGEQPPVPDLPPEAAKSRMNLALGGLLRAFAGPEHPLAVFIDDLQWADAASLDLLEYLVRSSEGAHVLFLGAYRDNEVGPDHQLTSVLASVKTHAPDIIEEMTLVPLEPKDVAEFVSDTVRSLQEPQPLIDFVLARTGGNPFFIRQLLLSLSDAQALEFDTSTYSWQWHPERAEQVSAANNVVDLLSQRLTRSSRVQQDLLRLAATIGKRFNRSTLDGVLSSDAEEDQRVLASVIRNELVRPVGTTQDDQTYVFAHDRVQQACAELPGEPSMPALHLAIGQLFLSRENADASAATIAEHLIIGLELVDDASERTRIGCACSAAGEEARGTLAYQAAARYYDIAIDLLPNDAWDQVYSATFSTPAQRCRSALHVARPAARRGLAGAAVRQYPTRR